MDVDCDRQLIYAPPQVERTEADAPEGACRHARTTRHASIEVRSSRAGSSSDAHGIITALTHRCSNPARAIVRMPVLHSRHGCAVSVHRLGLGLLEADLADQPGCRALIFPNSQGMTETRRLRLVTPRRRRSLRRPHGRIGHRLYLARGNADVEPRCRAPTRWLTISRSYEVAIRDARSDKRDLHRCEQRQDWGRCAIPPKPPVMNGAST